MKTPSGPSETSPPAPDLLRENARLREELAKEKRYTLGAEERTKLTGDALQAEGDAHALREELTRARAAHMENAELLAKANARVAALEGQLSEGRMILATVLAFTTDGSGLDDPPDVLQRKIQSHRHRMKGIIDYLKRTEPADRKGDAAQPPRVASDDPYWNGRCGVITHLAYGCPDPKGHGGDHSRVLLKAPSGPAAPAKEGE